MISNYGSEIEYIACDEVGGETVIVGGPEGLVVTAIGADTELTQVQMAPESCPLTKDSFNRDVGMFAVCKSCPNALVATADGGMEI